MLLAVDIGNTNIKFGVYDNDSLTFKLAIPTIRNLSAVDIARVAYDRLPKHINAAIISSVVPEVDEAVSTFIQTGYDFTPFFFHNDLDLGLQINYHPLADAGADRLVNTFSAVEKYGPPCIVCSFGTALTIDVVTADRTLVGGLIAPGMQTLAAALERQTSRLPAVAIEKPDKLLQTTTVGSIQSGIIYGYFGLVRELIERTKTEIGSDLKVIATGGFASMVAENTGLIDTVDENLLLDGLMMLYSRLNK